MKYSELNQALMARLRAEYNAIPFGKANLGEYQALVNLLEDHIGDLSSEASEYISRYDEPLAALYDMLPISLKSDVGTYDEDKVQEAIELIEYQIETLIERSAKEEIAAEPAQKKRVIEGYEEKQSVQLAGQLVIFAENPKADELYMVCYCKWDNPLGIEEYYNVCTTDDYIEAMGLYAGGIQSFLGILESERAGYDTPKQTLTAADCIPGGLNEDLTGKVIVIKPEVLTPEYRRSESQLKICAGGFGASPNARGNAVFCKDLYSGKESRFERYDVAGVAANDRLPVWAVKKIALMEALKAPGVFEFGGYHFKP